MTGELPQIGPGGRRGRYRPPHAFGPRQPEPPPRWARWVAALTRSLLLDLAVAVVITAVLWLGLIGAWETTEWAGWIAS